MMKIKLIAIIAFVLTTNSLLAQSSANKWPALKEFHAVISQTFHPAEEGNLAPIKARSEELMTKAKALLKLDMPAEFRTKSILDSAEKLKVKTKSLHRMVVAQASDADITKALVDIHDIFHEIAGQCSH